MTPLELVKLQAVMERARGGRQDVMIGLIDGPVAADLLMTENIRHVAGGDAGTCVQPDSFVCRHGTFVAGILSARPGSPAPAICPNCTLLVRPIFRETGSGSTDMPSATPDELAQAIVETIEAGAHVLNLSAALAIGSSKGEYRLQEALDQALKRGVLVVAAAGNQGTLGSSVITRHPWVIPVVACDLQGRPIAYSNLGSSIGRHGVMAPGEGVTSIGVDGRGRTFAGTSAAAPFATGTIALLLSAFPAASPIQVRMAVTRAETARRAVAPPLLDAWSAYETLAS